MNGEVSTFRALPIGAHFTCNGKRCIKQSSRTAKLIDYGRVFYFFDTTRITIGYAGLEVA